MRRVASVACFLAAAAASPALADPGPGADPAAIPAPIRAMLDAALASGNDGDVAVIIKYARAADPASGDAAQAIANAWHTHKTEVTEERVREATFLQLWSGKVELSGSKNTGDSDVGGVTVTADLKREGLRWRQKFHAQGDYQETNGVPTREHFAADYEPNYKLDDRRYLYGQVQYETDRFLGYTDRASGSVGAGYSAIKTPRIQLDLELGPAYRYTNFTNDTAESSLATRGSLNFKWKLLSNLSVSEVSSAYLERYNSTVSSTTSISAKLIGPLAAQLSYNIQYESQPPAGSVTTDTTSRAGLVYAF